MLRAAGCPSIFSSVYYYYSDQHTWDWAKLLFSKQKFTLKNKKASIKLAFKVTNI